MKSRVVLKLLLAGALACTSAIALAQQVTRIVVPFNAGGGTDQYARFLAAKLTEAGLRTIVENKSGASGIIAAEYVVRARPDGQTLFLGTNSTLANNTVLFDKLGLGGIYVREDSTVRRVEDLAGVEVAVGYHSGSHFSTIQSLEACLDRDAIKLAFVGMPYDRVDALLEGDVPAAAVWGASTYLVEQYGCRKVADSTFMAGFMFGSDTDPADVERYFNALKRAQMDLDFEPEKYKDEYRANLMAMIEAKKAGEEVVETPAPAQTGTKLTDPGAQRNGFSAIQLAFS